MDSRRSPMLPTVHVVMIAAYSVLFTGGIAQSASSSDPLPVDTTRQQPTSVDGSFDLGRDPQTFLPDDSPGTLPLYPPGFFSSPTGVLLRSVAFPGWGQWANGKKQKAVIYGAIESYFITKAVIWRHRAREADNPADFEDARRRRNTFYWMTGLTIFVSMFDAYADRYLLVLERTRREDDSFWGGPSQSLRAPADGWQLTLAIGL